MPEHEAFANVEVTGSLNGSAHPSDLDELSLSAFGARLKRIFLPGGQILFRENEVADSLDVWASLYGAAMAAMFWWREFPLAKP